MAVGEGGGSAIGFCNGGSGTVGWVTGDGESWMPLHRESDFALLPIYVPLEDGMMVKSLDGGGEEAGTPVVRPHMVAGPNPFNPATEIRFGLDHASDVVVDIYNLRGARVARLLDETMSAGHHPVRWLGVDGAGRTVASGPYFARLVAGDLKMTKRLMLIK